jgi:hypothetical protein
LERTRRKRDRASTRLPHHRVVKRDRGAPLNKTLDGNVRFRHHRPS